MYVKVAQSRNFEMSVIRPEFTEMLRALNVVELKKKNKKPGSCRPTESESPSAFFFVVPRR